ncbi:hypothetical protein [Tellurirhabdus bombi]|uniref:hypothetical protein n=1 Tax=Tellurirhabdus bombi TaxID=2907205 RepID=UPI001F46CF9D|nr:hypothetical protein [Tellurirhabdus bombi]
MRALLTTALLLTSLSLVFAQEVRPLRQKDPFPFAQGVAINQPTYELIKTKIAAADELSKRSKKAVDSLKAEIAGLDTALAAQRRFGQQRSQEYTDLAGRYHTARDALELSEVDLRLATNSLDALKNLLPRRYRKRVLQPEQLSLVYDEYLSGLRKQRWQFGAGGALLGVAGLIMLL